MPVSRPRALVATTALVLLLAHGAFAAPAAHAAPVPAGFFGVTVEGGPLGFDQPVNAEMRTIRGTGVRSITVAFNWINSQRTPARTYGWVVTDRVVTAAARAGLTVQPNLVQSPEWARHDPGELWSPPRSNADYAAWVRAAVARYGTRGTFWRRHRSVPRRPITTWQVWNEPVAGNSATGPSQFWVDDRPAIPAYAALLRTTARAIRRTDPRAQVLLAGLTGLSWKTLPLLYRAGARRSFDAVSLHPYTTRPRDVVRIVGLVRAVMRAQGDGRKPILVTEIGYPPFDALVAQQGGRRLLAQQPGWMRSALRALAQARRRLGIRSVFWHTWASLDGSSPFAFDFAGLTRWDPARATFTSKPALRTFRAVVRSARRG